MQTYYNDRDDAFELADPKAGARPAWKKVLLGCIWGLLAAGGLGAAAYYFSAGTNDLGYGDETMLSFASTCYT